MCEVSWLSTLRKLFLRTFTAYRAHILKFLILIFDPITSRTRSTENDAWEWITCNKDFTKTFICYKFDGGPFSVHRENYLSLAVLPDQLIAFHPKRIRITPKSTPTGRAQLGIRVRRKRTKFQTVRTKLHRGSYTVSYGDG